MQCIFESFDIVKKKKKNKTIFGNENGSSDIKGSVRDLEEVVFNFVAKQCDLNLSN